jgi:hypothetical protein
MNPMHTAPKDKPILARNTEGRMVTVVWIPLMEDANGIEGGWWNAWGNRFEDVRVWSEA